MNDKKRRQQQSQQMQKTTRMIVIVAAALAVAAVMFLAGCIKNDIPYPRIQANFTEFEAEGLSGPAEIDTVSRIVTLPLDETTNIEDVVVTSYKLSEGVSLESGQLDKPLNLSEPYVVTLKLYQTYDWVIRATQEIERYFTVENQIGETIIDAVAHRVVVTVPDNPGVKAVKVLSQKLGPSNATQEPDFTGKTIDLSEPLEVTVVSWGKATVWEIYAQETESLVTTTGVDAWSQVAWVFGSAVEGRDNGVEYRQTGSEEWIKAPADWITHSGATFTARLIHLNPETQYEARAYSDEARGAIVEFTTEGVFQMPNEDFSSWSQTAKNMWQPWGEGQESYWDTSNRGAAVANRQNVTPTDITATGSGRAAKLESIFIIAKFAAGSLFVGEFYKIVGFDGMLHFGRPYNLRPTKLKGYAKYDCATINKTNSALPDVKAGQPDTCIVWCALVDCDEPVTIFTKPSERTLFDKNAPYVIAYGEQQYGETVPEYVPFEITLNYNSTSRKPKYLLVVASSSKYGDYFVGGVGSTLYLDDFELDYDY